MNDDTIMFEKRMTELASRAASRGIYIYSNFLDQSQQSLLHKYKLGAPIELIGGYDLAERKLARFGDEYSGGNSDAPIVCLSISPTSQKFAQSLTHRDFLGSLMGLGIQRETLGDIIVYENCGYLFCLESVSEFITSQLCAVKRTPVKVARSEPPQAAVELPDIREAVVSSNRVDAVIAAIYRLSRSESLLLFKQERIFINSRTVRSASALLSEGDVVSVRGYGRFIYEGLAHETKKGRMRINVRVY